MKGHVSMGEKILGNSNSPYLKMGAEIALNHHERWDGGLTRMANVSRLFHWQRAL
jgi:hypothetical protein